MSSSNPFQEFNRVCIADCMLYRSIESLSLTASFKRGILQLTAAEARVTQLPDRDVNTENPNWKYAYLSPRTLPSCRPATRAHEFMHTLSSRGISKNRRSVLRSRGPFGHVCGFIYQRPVTNVTVTANKSANSLR